MLGLCLYFCIRHVGEYSYIVQDRNFSYFCDNWRKENFLRYIPRTVMYGNVIEYTGLCGQHVYAKYQVYLFEHVWDGDAQQPIHSALTLTSVCVRALPGGHFW